MEHTVAENKLEWPHCFPIIDNNCLHTTSKWCFDIQWNLNYPDPTYLDSWLAENNLYLNSECFIRVIENTDIFKNFPYAILKYTRFQRYGLFRLMDHLLRFSATLCSAYYAVLHAEYNGTSVIQTPWDQDIDTVSNYIQ